VLDALGTLPASERLEFFEMPRIDISSTLVRSRIAEGLPVRHFVPDAVADEIATAGLYGASPTGAAG
jgi:nicotinate-nucleotide adenylyltransferase